MDLLTQLLPIVTFLLGFGVGIIAWMYYMRRKARKALGDAQELMENGFEDLPE